MSLKQPVVLPQRQSRKCAVCDGQTTTEQNLKPSVVSPPIVETDFAQLEDGSLVEMIEDPENLSRAKFVLYKEGEAQIVDQVELPTRILKPPYREAEFIKHVRLPRGVKHYNSLQALLWRMNEEILSRCLDLSDRDRFLLACFVLSSWLIDYDRMPVAPYLALVGLPSSGKSTVLKVLRLLCRRSLLTADISSAAFYRVCERLTPTLLIDETTTAGNSRDLPHLLRIGTSRDVVTLRKDQSFTAYGAKVVAWNELPNDPALNSRCIIILMQETTRRDLKSPNDAEILAAADDLQQQLLQYRIEKFNKLNSPEIVDDKRPPLFARWQDLHKALGLSLDQEPHYCDWLLDCLTFQMLSNLEPLAPNHAAVLQTLYRVIHLADEDKEGYRMLDLTGLVNVDLKKSGESRRLAPRGVGAALSALGISTRTRTNQGWYVHLNRDAQKRIHDLVLKHGLENEFLLPPRDACERCDLCPRFNDMRTVPHCYRFLPRLKPPYHQSYAG